MSALATASSRIIGRDSASYEKVADLIKLATPPIISEKREASTHLLKRMLLAMLTGNGDLHLENLSLTGSAGRYRFTSVYDPTPMRAYSLHNMLTPMSFGGYGEPGISDGINPLRRAFENFTRYLGLSRAMLDQSIAAMQQVSASLPDRINALERLPAEHKDRLIKVTQDASAKMSPTPP